MFKVFKRSVAMRLKQEGFPIEDCMINLKHRDFIVYMFNDTEEFRVAFERVQRELKEEKSN